MLNLFNSEEVIMFSNSSKKSSEAINPVSYNKEAGCTHSSLAENTREEEKRTDSKYKLVTIDTEEEWKRFFELQNDPSTNTTNKVRTKSHIHRNSEGMLRYTAEENKYYGKEIIGKIVKQVKEEIIENIKDTTIKLIRLRESKNADTSVKPVIRIVLGDNKKAIVMKDLLSGDTCKKYGVKTVTLCLPDKRNTRGIRCQIDEHETRIYEVANGSYDMTLNWYVEGKEYKMKINISDDGSIKLIESNGVTWEQLAAHKEVKVGRQYEAKPLYEALSYLKQESSEIVEVSQQPSTSVTPPTKVEDVKTPQNIDQIIRDCLSKRSSQT